MAGQRHGTKGAHRAGLERRVPSLRRARSRGTVGVLVPAWMLAVGLGLLGTGCGGGEERAGSDARALDSTDVVSGAPGGGAAPLHDEAPPANSAARPLDVLIISLDTLRADALSCYGNRWDTSPNIDALALRGVRFDRAYAPAPHTAPSHMSLFTGLLPIAHGVPNQGGQEDHALGLARRWPTLTSLLADAGWQVAVAAEGGQLRAELGFFEGAHDVDLKSTRMSETIGAFRRFVNGADEDRPLFAFFHTYEPHAPYMPPDEADGVQFHGRFTKPGGGGMFRARFEVLRRRGDHDAHMALVFLDDFEGRNDRDVEFLRGLYHENVAYTDHQLAQVLRIWERRRGLDDTLLVILSDHGEQLGERGAFGHRQGLEPELTRVPMIVLAPGLEPRVVHDPIGLVNLPATLLELLDLAVPGHMAPSFTRALRGEGAGPNAVHQQDTLSAADVMAVVRGRHQYLVGRARDTALDTLHDLVDDPRAQSPLDVEQGTAREIAHELAELVRVRRTLDARIQSQFPARRVPFSRSRDELERLRFLGYLTDDEK